MPDTSEVFPEDMKNLLDEALEDEEQYLHDKSWLIETSKKNQRKLDKQARLVHDTELFSLYLK